MLPGYATFARLHRVGTSLPVQWNQPDPGWEPLALTAALPPSATVFLLETPGGAPDLERRSFLAWDPDQEFILRRGMLETRRHGSKPILRRCRTPLAVLQRALATAGASAVPYTEGFHGGLVGYVGFDFKNCLERLPDRVRDDLATPELRLGRTVYKDHQRFIDTYFSTYPGMYFTGDGCRRDEDGYFWITGRVDDVLNVSGHRLGTAEIESALVAHPKVAEAAVVGYPHDIKGQGIYAYVLLTSEYAKQNSDQLLGALKEQVRHVIGAFATPDVLHVVSGLPKTRSGKIMRRILRKIASGEYTGLGDVTTLADPHVVDRLIAEHRALSGTG